MPVLQVPEAQSLTDRAWELYYRLRPSVETPENIGKLLLLDFGSGDFEIDDETGFEPVHRLQSRHPDSKLFALRIGYETAVSFSGSLERLSE